MYNKYIIKEVFKNKGLKFNDENIKDSVLVYKKN